MIGTWEIRVFGVDPTARCKVRAQRVYRFFAMSYTEASAKAEAKATAEGLHAPCVWAATRLPDYEETDQ